MRRMKKWTALLLSMFMLLDAVPAQGAQPEAGLLQEEQIYQESIEVETEQASEIASEVEREDTEKSTEGVMEAATEELEEVNTEAVVEVNTENWTQPWTDKEETLVEPQLGTQESLGDEDDEVYQLVLDYNEDLIPDGYLVPGNTLQLITSASSNIPMEELIYESEDETIATVSNTGLVTAVSAGESGSSKVKISVTYTTLWDDKITGYCYLLVENELQAKEDIDTDMYAGQIATIQLEAKATPSTLPITWSSDDSSVASVDANGVVTAHSAGYAVIRASIPGKTVSWWINVDNPSLYLPSTATAYVGHSVSIGADVSPGIKVTWTTSNSKIATVNNGKVTGKKAGKVYIYAKVPGSSKKKCKVTVEKPSLTISDGYSYWWGDETKTTTIYKGSKFNLNVSVSPSDAKIKWKSSKKKVATVNKKGVISALRTGTTTITASIKGAKSTWTIKVIPKKNSKLNFTSRKMTVGSEVTLYVKNAPDATFNYGVVDANGGISVTSSGNGCTIKAVEAGKYQVYASFRDYSVTGNPVWRQLCTIEVEEEGISEQQFALAKGQKKELSVITALESPAITGTVWSSSKTSVAVVDAGTGEVTAKKTGSATITANVTFEDGSQKRYSAVLKVSNPSLKSKKMVVALNGSKNLNLKGMNSYSRLSFKTSNKKVLTVDVDGSIHPKKNGTAKVTITVDGKKLTCNVSVSNPSLAESYAALAPGGTATLKINGLVKGSTVTYSVSNPSVANVMNNTIVAYSGGRSVITVNADGNKMNYLVEVASATAINARINAYNIMYSSTYSQAQRMTTGYYDCSSLVFRGYGRNSDLLGGSYGWAPTAADMAKHMAATGKVIVWGSALNVEDLRPGDLLFYGGESNGRYLGIYHVSMYFGNGDRLEKPLRSVGGGGSLVMVARPAP